MIIPELGESQNDFFSLHAILNESVPAISMALARVVENRMLGGGRGRRSSAEQLAGVLLRQGGVGQWPGSLPRQAPSFGRNPMQGSGCFHISQGQMMAQMASAIARASQRYL